MRIDMVDERIGEQLPDRAIGLARLGQRRIAHHPVPIERPQRKHATGKRRRNRIAIGSRPNRLLTNENGVGCPIGIFAVMRDMIDEQSVSPGSTSSRRTRQGKPGLLSRDHANGTMRGELFVGQADKMGEAGGVEPLDSIGHGGPSNACVDYPLPAACGLIRLPPCIAPRLLLGARQPMRGARFCRCAPFDAWGNS